MSGASEARSGGIGVGSLLGVLFVALKLTRTIDWSWWWVLAPFWAPWAFVLALFLIAGLVALAEAVLD